MGMVEKSYRSGEVICKEGESGKSFFMLLEGTASVYADYDKKDPLRLAVLEAGEFFGEMAIIEDYPRNATVVAKTNARAVEIPRDELKGFFTENPDLIVELMGVFGIDVEATLAAAQGDDVRFINEHTDQVFTAVRTHICRYAKHDVFGRCVLAKRHCHNRKQTT